MDPDPRTAAGGPDELLTIGELEARTGVASSSLRAWERRLGFPVPVRTSGGQRRYRAKDVDQILRVLEERGRGLTLTAAVRAASRKDAVGNHSLFATLRAQHPHVDPIRVSMRVMQALTWSIEDECLAHASRPLLFGCFQDQRSYRTAGRRWRELARSASTAVALADFDATDPDSAPVRVSLPSSSPMLNEWSLVCLDPQLSVVLAAWEPPSRGRPGEPRQFEALLSLEPDVVRDAALHFAAVCKDLGLPDLTSHVGSHTDGLVEDPRRTASLLRRFAAYADA
jgi:DNA-binding transcriptional MerR regulator